MAKASKGGIPQNIKEEVQGIVAAYNKKHGEQYQVRFRGQFCYLSRVDDQSAEAAAFAFVAKAMGLGIAAKSNTAQVTEIGRLKWCEDMKSWDFAVYKYSREGYDPDELWFPGAELLDGTIEGALKAGKKIYP